MKYMLLIWSNPENWDAVPEAEHAEYTALDQALLESGELVISAELADPVTTRTVRVSDGVAATTDGPFLEAKEHLSRATSSWSARVSSVPSQSPH